MPPVTSLEAAHPSLEWMSPLLLPSHPLPPQSLSSITMSRWAAWLALLEQVSCSADGTNVPASVSGLEMQAALMQQQGVACCLHLKDNLVCMSKPTSMHCC